MPATNKDIDRALKDKSYEYIRKITRQLSNKKGEGIIITLPERKHHEEQFVLTNMQHVINPIKRENKDSNNYKTIENDKMELVEGTLTVGPE